MNRAQRWYDATDKAWGYSRGPVSSADLMSHERLERPIMKVFQRHPGNNMPEAQEIVKVTLPIILFVELRSCLTQHCPLQNALINGYNGSLSIHHILTIY